MGKRKRDTDGMGVSSIASSSHHHHHHHRTKSTGSTTADGTAAPADPSTRTTVQIVVGSYERILQGITATFPRRHPRADRRKSRPEFADTFLFHAHASAIRCLAVSPLPSNPAAKGAQKVVLASGSTDERINLYQLSSTPPTNNAGRPVYPTLVEHPVMEHPRNRELGSLLHHAASITALHFPTRAKLLSSAEDNMVAITRTRDWVALSNIKAPIPRAHGRPSGDTAPAGATPAGINDFAVHPSMKVMLSVSRAEPCMRLWNLVTGKKAGTLRFDKNIIHALGESKKSSGEGRKLDWNATGEEFVVGFERGAVVYRTDCKPKCLVMLAPRSRIHQMKYVRWPSPTVEVDAVNDDLADVLAVSTEDGRVLFFSTTSEDVAGSRDGTNQAPVPSAKLLGQLGGKSGGVTGRVKDLVLLPLSLDANVATLEPEMNLLVVTGGSDGIIRLWLVGCSALSNQRSSIPRMEQIHDGPNDPTESSTVQEDLSQSKQLGILLGSYETHLRITCLTAFVMASPPSDLSRATNGNGTMPSADEVEVEEEEEEEEEEINKEDVTSEANRPQ